MQEVAAIDPLGYTLMEAQKLHGTVDICQNVADAPTHVRAVACLRLQHPKKTARPAKILGQKRCLGESGLQLKASPHKIAQWVGRW